MLDEGEKNQLEDEESAIKSGNWAEGEGRGGVVGKCVASSPLYQRVHGGGRAAHGLSRHQSHDWAHDKSMGSVGLKIPKISTK